MKWLVVLVLAIVAAACRRGGRERFGYWPLEQPGDTMASRAMFGMFETGDGDLLVGSGYRNLSKDFATTKGDVAVPVEVDDLRLRV
jgi:hypothetical protein